MLEDVTPDNGPLMVIPKSHKGPLLSHKANGLFCGAIDADDPLFEQGEGCHVNRQSRVYDGASCASAAWLGAQFKRPK